MAGIEELSPAAGPVATRPPEDEIDDDDDDDLDETLVERLWGLTEMFPDTVRTAAEFSAQCSVSLAKKFYSLSRSALWVGTTSFMILVLPVVFETERLQLEQQQLQQQRQILLGPNTGIWWDARHDAVSPGKDLRTMRCPLQAWMCCHNNAGLVAARGDIETVQKRKELLQQTN